MFLEDIENTLRKIDSNTFYGMVDESRMETVWDYIVFNRTAIRHSMNKTSASDRFDVHIIRENYIPDGLENEVIDALCELPGVRLTGDDTQFNYVQKPNTNVVVEMMTISFLRARKT